MQDLAHITNLVIGLILLAAAFVVSAFMFAVAIALTTHFVRVVTAFLE